MARRVRYVGYLLAFHRTAPPLHRQEPFTSVRAAADHLRSRGARLDTLRVTTLRTPIDESTWPTHKMALTDEAVGREFDLHKGPNGGISGGGL